MSELCNENGSPTVGVVLSGCGVNDGTEIYEAAYTVLALDKAGAAVRMFAPDADFTPVHHGTGKPMDGETRNALVEAQRIARGEAVDLAEARAGDLDALVFPGGFGAASVLCSFASDGAEAKVHPEVERIVKEMHGAGKWIGAICIAPTIVARVLGEKGVELTVGDPGDVPNAMEAMGAKHKTCPVDEYTVDEDNKVLSTPAYMSAGRVSEAHAGIERMVTDLVERARSS